MKKFAFLLIVVFIHTVSSAQTQYEVLKDYVNGGKILKGIISREMLTNDSSFKWYAQNLKPYAAEKAPAISLAKHKDSVQLVIFLGTWCEDSHIIIPKLFPFLDASGFPDERITLVGVDRNKKTISHLAEAFDVINVPTVIVMKQGKEIGRVVEYGRYGLVEKELAEIVETK
jgi:hypothetical protein